MSRRGTGALHGLLAVGLLLGVYLLVLAFLGAAVGCGWLIATHGIFVGSVQLLMMLVMAAVLMLRAVLRSLRVPAPAPRGLPLTRTHQPRLWETVTTLAAAVGTPPPDEIYLVAEVNAQVEEDARWLGLRRGVRRLYLGAPLVLGMPTGELLAVLGHELGHLGARHDASMRVTVRGSATLVRIVAGLDNPLLRGLFSGYLRLYEAASAATWRANEKEADRAAVAVTGRDAMTAALHRLPALDVAWHAVCTEYAPLADLAGRTPDLFAAYAAVLAEPGRWAAFEEARRAELARPTRSGDQHPATQERLALIARCPAGDVRPDRAPATALVADLPRTLRLLQNGLGYGRIGPPSGWPEAAALGVRKATGRLPCEVARAAGPQAPPLTLGRVLDALADGSAGALAERVLNPALAVEERPAARRRILTALVADWLTRAMLDARLARVRLRWAGDPAYDLVTADGRPVDPSAMVTDAVGAALPDRGRGDARPVVLLRERLRGMGVRLDRAVDPAEHEADDIELRGVLTHVKLDRARGDLLVLDVGLLFVKHPLVSLRLSRRDQERRRIARLMGSGAAELARRPGNRWIGTTEIVAAVSYRRRLAQRLELRLAEGTTATLSSTLETSDLGETGVLDVGAAWPAVGRLLGARLQPA